MHKLLLIFLGSGLGGVLRFLLNNWTHRLAGTSFPLGTLVVNVLGCLVIGFLAAAFAGRFAIREEYRIALTVGILGGFTTFSTFGLQTFHLSNNGQHGFAVANVVLSCALGLAAVWIGYRLGDAWLGT